MNHDLLKQNWNSRGYTFGIFKDPPGQVWADFVHKTDELVVLAEGEIEIEIEGKSQRPQIGEEVFIPANALHTVEECGEYGECLVSWVDFRHISIFRINFFSYL